MSETADDQRTECATHESEQRVARAHDRVALDLGRRERPQTDREEGHESDRTLDHLGDRLAIGFASD